MKSNTMHHTRRFSLTSYGNGLAYVLENRVKRSSILFQGDDADHMRNELEVLTNGRLPISTDDALGVLWNDYCESARRDDALSGEQEIVP